MSNTISNFIYFVFLIVLYCFLNQFSGYDISMEIIAFSYMEFLELLYRFSFFKNFYPWGRWL